MESKQYRFRLYTENKSNLIELTQHYFDNATLLETTGLYDRQIERGIIIEVIVLDAELKNSMLTRFYNLAAKIKEVNRQECVLVTIETLTSAQLR